MKAVILAAGKGVRMRPLTLRTPKTLLRVAGAPILEHAILALPRTISEVIIVVGWKADQVKRYVKSRFPTLNASFVLQKKLLGTFDALLQAQRFLSSHNDVLFLVLNGDDVYSRHDLDVLVKASLLHRSPTVLVKSYNHAERFGIVKVNKSSFLRRITETPHKIKKGLVNTGAYVLDGRIFTCQPPPLPSGEVGLSSAVAMLALEQPVHVVSARDWIPIGFPHDLKLATQALLSRAKYRLQKTRALRRRRSKHTKTS